MKIAKTANAELSKMAVVHHSTIMETVIDTPLVIDESRLKQILSSVAKKRFTSKLSPTMQKILYNMLEVGNTTNKILAEKTGMAPQNVSKYLKELTCSGCIFLVKTEGTTKFYSVSDWVRWSTLEV